MTRWKIFSLVCLALILSAAIYGIYLVRRGFSAAEEPSALEKLAARAVRNLAWAVRH